MNKHDIFLIIVICTLSLFCFTLFNLNQQKENLNALVYYDNELVLTIDLSKEEQLYEVKGYNVIVSIKAGNGRIKVEDEESPLHLCSKQGYISKSYETIVCLPNKIYIELDGKNNIDVIVE